MLENHSKSSVIGDPNAPFINSLAQSVRGRRELLRRHASERAELRRGHLGLELVRQRRQPGEPLRPHEPRRPARGEASSRGARTWSRCRPSGYTGDFWPGTGQQLYASKHNPFVLFNDIRSNPARLANDQAVHAISPPTCRRCRRRRTSSGSRRTSATTCTAASSPRSRRTAPTGRRARSGRRRTTRTTRR